MANRTNGAKRALLPLIPLARAPAPRPRGAPLSLAIVVPTYRRPEPLARLLAGLVPQAIAHRAQLIVVNDGSHDAAYARVVAGFGDAVDYAVLEHNVGRGQATNHGISLARADWLLFTDDDVIVPPDWIDTVAGIIARYPRVDAIGGRTVAATDGEPGLVERFTILRDVYVPQPHFTNGTLKCLITACLAVRRETLEAVGALDGDFPCGQDHNLTWRLRKHGAAIHVTHRWACGHDQAWSVGDLTRRLREYAYWHVMQADLSRDPVDYEANPATSTADMARRLPTELRELRNPGRYRGLRFAERQAFRALDLAAFWAWNWGGVEAGRILRRQRAGGGV